ncbi:Ribbon-helix-helix protein, copG family [Frankineae bacterium MT45]|nr:Ribbon-helix-helix protein, copG family [Frankineae bacterium MT45]
MFWYRRFVSTNLRLSEETAAALRGLSERSGRSQQDLLRDAVNRYLGLTGSESSRDRAVSAGVVRPPTPFQDVVPFIELGDGVRTLELLDRDDER